MSTSSIFDGVYAMAAMPNGDLLVGGSFTSAGGVAVLTQFAIPNSLAIVGHFLHHQVVPFELDVTGNILAVTSTNALRLTIGSF